MYLRDSDAASSYNCPSTITGTKITKWDCIWNCCADCTGNNTPDLE